MDPEHMAVAFEGNEVDARIAYLKLEDGGIQAELIASSIGGVPSVYVNDCLSGNFKVAVLGRDLKKASAILSEETGHEPA